MSSTIGTIKNPTTGDDIYPRTKTSAVYDDSNNGLDTLLAGKQATLISGTNIKTINEQSILGSGNIAIGGGGGSYTSGDGIDITNNVISVNNTIARLTDVPAKISDLTDDTATYPIDKADTLTGLTATVAELNYVDGVTSNIQTQLNNKQAVISDLSTIRSGASAGATAYQKPAEGIPSTDMTSAVQTSLGLANNSIQTSSKGAANGVASLDNTGKVPNSQLPEINGVKIDPTTTVNGDVFIDTTYDTEGNLIDDIYGVSFGHAQTLSSEQKIIAITNIGAEQETNKVSSWQPNPDNTHYPSELLVKGHLDDINNLLDEIGLYRDADGYLCERED